MVSFLQSPLPETIAELEDQIALIEETQGQCMRTIRELMAREDPMHGVAFPAEIHELHQQKNMLETHKEFRKVRIRRLRFQESGR
ncbi:MAG: hypothetical protein J1E80_02645 [Desulfovibrionaceae bacterium]|nr:hypothetical protein [Desulfovibrionaceae bacterium]